MTRDDHDMASAERESAAEGTVDAVGQPPAAREAPPLGADGRAGGEPAVGAEPASELGTLRERVVGLERELASERDRATDYMQRWQRAQADLSNVRRRAQQEQEQLAALAATQSMALVLPALDSLERAFQVLPETLHHLTWIEGIALVELQLRRALEAQGMTPFEPQPGEPLDLARHHAIAQTETGEHPEGHIVAVVQRGYELRGRVLRPALVAVARAPATNGGDGEATASDASAASTSADVEERGSSP